MILRVRPTEKSFSQAYRREETVAASFAPVRVTTIYPKAFKMCWLRAWRNIVSAH